MQQKLRVLLKDVGYRVPHGDYLLSSLNIAVHDTEKIALIGRNGVGKTTVLKMIAGMLKPTKGHIEKYGKAVYLPQVHFDLSKDTELYEFISEFSDDWWEVLSYAQNHFCVGEISPNRKIATLSGGELMKIYLSKFLIANPDILLLDEPTNHIDILSLDVLIQTLKEFRGAVICATHDTFFINQFADKVVEIEDKTFSVYGGDYDHYVKMKLTLENAHERKVFAVKVKQKRLTRAIKIIADRAEQGKARAMDKHLASGMSRMERGYFAERAFRSKIKLTNALESKKEKVTEKLKSMQKIKPKGVEFHFSDVRSTIDDLLVQYKGSVLSVDNEEIVKNINFSLKRGERIAILGRNGAGKTLFLKSLIGLDTERISISGEVTKAECLSEYIGQDFSKIVAMNTDNSRSVLSALEDDKKEVYKHLVGQLGLENKDVYRAVDSFSGGELTTLLLLDLSSKYLDMIVLDEPTNHLDISAQDALISALNEYKGTLVVTSHRLDFISHLHLDNAFVISGKELIKLRCNLDNSTAIYQQMVKIM